MYILGILYMYALVVIRMRSCPLFTALACPQAIHTRDELAEKVQELEEELSMAIKELQSQQFGIKAANKQMSEVCRIRHSN